MSGDRTTKDEGAAFVHEAGDGDDGVPEVVVRFTGSIEEQREACRAFVLALSERARRAELP